eukprot:scaffold4074_cov85-Skeletonema_dohrnii-CCMP3373.AAC.2
MSSKSNSKEAIILTDWIRRALVGINLSTLTSCGAGTNDPPSQCPDATIRNSSVALCSSDDYLMPALQLAYSLVNQICNEEEASGKSPTLSVDWVDNIVVYDNNRARCGSLDSLGFDPFIAVEDNFDAEDLFESTIHDRDGGATLSEEKTDQSTEEGCDSIRAELPPSLFSANNDDDSPSPFSANDDDGLYSRIYSLGVVFHVLFSGGERSAHHFPTPTELLETQKLSFTSDETEELLSPELSKDSKLSGDLDIFDSIDGSDPFFGDETFDDAPTQFLDPKKRYASQQQNRDNSNNCCAPVESLREKGLPNSLCDLVANMLDCTNGTLSGEDSYQNMSDVRSDLRLMLDNPNTFLRDLDMTKLSTRGPQFIEKTMFGRNVELSIIKDAYRRSISGECGLVTISGTSGTGKSLLANEFGKYVSAEGGVFLSGKFDQLQQDKPFNDALASTFDQYCGILLHEDMASTKEEVSSQLRSVLGKELYHLTKIIPTLATILGSELPVLNHSDDCIKAQKRLQYLFCQFVEVISNSSSAPITLFLDDLQWADAASIVAVNQLLFATGSSSQKKKKNFFVLGCIRGRDSASKWLPCVDILVAGGINVKLDCMNEHTLNTMVSETLYLSPRLTHTLSSVIYHETKGNPLSVSRLMRLLNKEGLLRPSLNRRRWEWDVKKIRSAMFLTESLEELPDIGNCYPLTKMSDHHRSKSNQPITAASQPEPVSLKQWTVGAVDSLRSRSEGGKGKLVCSHEYLSCALQIAHSLANQLSTVEQERAYKEKSPSLRNNNSPPMTGALDKSWSEYISVYCMTKTKDASAKSGFEPLLSSKRDNVDPGGLHNWAQQLSTLLENDNKQNSIDYLDVRGAILNEGAVDGRPLSDDGKLEMRSLGIAFYELFSGGHLTVGAETWGHTAAESEVGEGDELLGHNPTKRRTLQSNTSLDGLSQVQSPSMASTSVEPLKLLGLPTALCDLISNMIDSVDGDANENGETYGLISEVRDDLKLMIDSPNLYLQDVDLAKAVNVGLQFGGSLYGRETELQTLKECYQRSISSECEVAMICGTSGIGKSKLSQEFARSVNEDGGSIYLSGRFDKLESQPLHAISSAFDKYCAWVTAGDQSTAEKVSTALKENMGEEMACLVTAIPNLANILGDDFNSTQSSKNDDTAVDAQKRLRYLFYLFVDVISRCHEEPLILFLDDCQWIDNASVALLNQILMISGSAIKDHRYFFFGACRDDEMSESHPLNSMLTSVSSLCGTKTTKIQLTSMSKEALNEMVSTELSLLPRITRPLANILHHKTKGSPLFVKQVMMELYKQRLLYPSLSRRRWVWETNKILDMKIPDNVATFITNTFDHLSFEVVSALVVLSCFGASADISLIQVLEKEIEQPLIAPLDDAVAHSVLGKRNRELYFMHDKLQEAAYSKMRPEERCLHHNR